MDKGIIFSAPMVRALRDGRKTQTRRLAKFVQPDQHHLWRMHGNCGGLVGATDSNVRVYGPDYSPYAPGDRLYVREAWRADSQLDSIKPSEMGHGEPILYEMDGTLRQRGCAMIAAGKLRPSIFLPRWASRLTLTVTDVRVQRVAEISEADARAEGLSQWNIGGEGVRWNWHDGPAVVWSTAREAFEALWNSLHTKPGERWADNPWIVAVSFTVVHGNIDRISG